MNHGRKERDGFHCGGKSSGRNNPSRQGCVHLQRRLFEVSKCNMVHFQLKWQLWLRSMQLKGVKKRDINDLIFVERLIHT